MELGFRGFRWWEEI